MGIYHVVEKDPETVHPDGSRTWVERQKGPGFVNTRTVTATPWAQTERTDCFCCTCDEISGMDPFCRNHGYAGERPCDLHGMAGVPTEGGYLPASVQEYRTAHTQASR